MSTFLGLVEEIPGVSVDRFDGENLNSSVYFLSHCHTDHMRGLSPDFFRHLQRHNKYLYCSSISKAFLEAEYYSEDSSSTLDHCVKGIAVDERVPVEYEDKNNGIDVLSVTCISAGHCPGSVMFLFEKADKSVLYTGDFRINPLDYRKIGPLHFRQDSDTLPRKLTKMYLDTTFLDPDFASLPTRRESISVMRGVIKEWLEKSPRNAVVLECSALYGSEFLYMELSKSLNMRIHVKDRAYHSYRRIPDLARHVAPDPSTTSIHACTNKLDRTGLKCRRDVLEKDILTVVPSVLKWRGKDTSKVGEWDEVRERVFNVCYSAHASLNELEAFVRYFEPEEVFPCVCPQDSRRRTYLLLDQITSKSKRRKTDNAKHREKYTLQVLKREDIDKPWAKYYFCNSDEGN